MSTSVDPEDISFIATESSVSLAKKNARSNSGYGSIRRSDTLPKRKCFKYNFRLLKNRGAILCLLWNLLIFSYQNLALGKLVSLFEGLEKKSPWKLITAMVFLQSCLPFLLYPIAGWIADAKIGRYKVIRGSLWLIWIAALFLLALEIISYIVKDLAGTDTSETLADEFLAAVSVLIYILNAVGIAGFQANLIPFGVDQMEDGSSDQYSAFIHWYYWTRNGSFGLILQLIIQSFRGYCETEESASLHELTDRYDLFILLVQVGFVTLAVCLDLVSNQVLNKDPKVHNPLKKVWKVSKFIAQNDNFVGYRKAITYTYDEPLQRSDFAKRMYGGPFDSDYVEDVKTFWKMLVFIFSLGLGGVFLNDSIYYSYRIYVNHLQLPPPSALSNCTTRHAIAELVYPMAFTLFIPFFEFFVHPFFRKYVPRMMVRISIGMVLMFLAAVGMLVVDAVGHAAVDKSVCMMMQTHSDPNSLHHTLEIPMVYAIPLMVLMALGEMLTFIAALELVLAQSPFGMRGLLIGVFYAMNGIFDGLVGLLLLFVALPFQGSHIFDIRGLSCGSWYYLTAVVFGFVGIVLFFVGAVWYKKRQRGGHRTLINHQTIIESYYETSSDPEHPYH